MPALIAAMIRRNVSGVGDFAGHVGRQPGLELARAGRRPAAAARRRASAPLPPVTPRRHTGTLAARARAITPSTCARRHRDDVARLVLAEPEGVRRHVVGRSVEHRADAAAIAISATATRRPPSDTSCTALAVPSRISAAHEVAVLALLGRDRPAAARRPRARTIRADTSTGRASPWSRRRSGSPRPRA